MKIAIHVLFVPQDTHNVGVIYTSRTGKEVMAVKAVLKKLRDKMRASPVDR